MEKIHVGLLQIDDLRLCLLEIRGVCCARLQLGLAAHLAQRAWYCATGDCCSCRRLTHGCRARSQWTHRVSAKGWTLQAGRGCERLPSHSQYMPNTDTLHHRKSLWYVYDE